MVNKKGNYALYMVVIVFCLTILMLGFMILGGYWTTNSVNECVKEKWIKSAPGSTDQTYMVGMQSGEVYTIKDSVIKWQFASSNLYNSVTEGQCYDIDYFGWRVPFFSMYHIIIDVKEVQS